jgi:hypothetical protein
VYQILNIIKMKQKDLEQIKEGDFIQHKHFGLCYVDKRQLDGFGRWFGLSIRPLSIQGFMTLANWSGVGFNRTVEDSNRLIVSKVENPKIPKLIFKTKKGFEAHKWKKLGKVSDKGKFSTIRIKECKNQDEAMSFAEFS